MRHITHTSTGKTPSKMMQLDAPRHMTSKLVLCRARRRVAVCGTCSRFETCLCTPFLLASCITLLVPRQFHSRDLPTLFVGVRQYTHREQFHRQHEFRVSCTHTPPHGQTSDCVFIQIPHLLLCVFSKVLYTRMHSHTGSDTTTELSTAPPESPNCHVQPMQSNLFSFLATPHTNDSVRVTAKCELSGFSFPGNLSHQITPSG